MLILIFFPVYPAEAYPSKLSSESSFRQCGEVQHEMLYARCDEVRTELHEKKILTIPSWTNKSIGLGCLLHSN